MPHSQQGSSGTDISAAGATRIRFQVQPTVSHYREPLVRRLLATSRAALTLVGRFRNTEADPADRIHAASEEALAQVTPLRVSAWGIVWWEHGQVSAVWRGDEDLYVLEGRIYTLSTWVAAYAGWLRSRRVVLWGHGWKRAEGRAKRLLRRCFYAPVTGLMVYGDQAKEWAVSYGMAAEKIAVVYNSLYSAADIPAHREVTAVETTGDDDDAAPALDGSFAAGSTPAGLADAGADPARRSTLIYSSRLTTRHRLDLLVEALQQWPQGSLAPRVIVIGDGAERPRLEKLFADAGIDAHFLGALYDRETLAGYYAHADCALSIGGAGLNVIQALGFGVPVVAEAGHRDSSPEIEAVQEGQTGRFYQAGDADSLRQVLIQTLSDREEAAQMGARGLAVVHQRYTAERHAEAILVALERFAQR